MRPVVLLDTVGCPSPACLRWFAYAYHNELTLVIAHNAPMGLIGRIAPDVILLVRTHYTGSIGQPVKVSWCELSAEGPVLGAYLQDAADHSQVKLELRGLSPSPLAQYKPVGLDVSLTGHLLDDCDALQLIAESTAKYFKAKGN